MVDQVKPIQLTDDELKAIEGMPPHVAAGFISASRSAQAPKTRSYQELLDDLTDLQRDVFKRNEE